MSQVTFKCKACGYYAHKESTNTQRELNKEKKRGLCVVCATKEDLDRISLDMSNIACNFESLCNYTEKLQGYEKVVLRIKKCAEKMLDVYSKLDEKPN